MSNQVATDAPDPKAPRMTWVHWVLYDLPPDTTDLAEGVKSLPVGTKGGLNDWKRTGFGGPCPPIGRHRYFFKLYALDTKLAGLVTRDAMIGVAKVEPKAKKKAPAAAGSAP